MRERTQIDFRYSQSYIRLHYYPRAHDIYQVAVGTVQYPGVGHGYYLVPATVDAVSVPVIASGGVGELQHLVDGVTEGGADAVLAASIFHFGQHTIPEAKAFMKAQGIEVRE